MKSQVDNRITLRELGLNHSEILSSKQFVLVVETENPDGSGQNVFNAINCDSNFLINVVRQNIKSCLGYGLHEELKEAMMHAVLEAKLEAFEKE